MTDAQHKAKSAEVRWIGVADAEALHKIACQRILEAAGRTIKQRGQFLIVLAGGSTPQGIYRMLRRVETDWTRWHVYLGDERCLPPENAARNSWMVRDCWLDHVAIPAGQFHIPPAERGPHAAALAYSRTLHGVGDFDLVLLGLGEDGHTASLFPGHDGGLEADAPDVLAVFDAPKPPPERLSLSAARLSRSRAVVFLVAGEEKRKAVAQWRGGADIPARSIRPGAGVDVLVEATLLSP